MTWQTPAYTMEFELAGIGNGWTYITADLTDEPIVLDYGIQSTKPDVRVATPGTLSFGLRNDAGNSGGTLGYYSPYSASRRSGFGFNIRVRYFMNYGADTRRWIGRLRQIDAVPDTFGDLVVHCVAYDWLYEATRQNLRVALQQNQRSDQCFSALIATVPLAPEATSIDVGADTYVYAFDNLYGSSDVLSACAELARSELGYIFVKRDDSDGQTLVFESRHTRQTVSTLRATLTTNLQSLDVANVADDILNHVRVTVHPRRTDTGGTTIVAKVDGVETAPLGPGLSQTLWLNFTDPVQRDSFVGAVNVVTPLVATTDYTYNSAADGSGTNLTAAITVSATVFASTIRLVVTNTGAVAAFRTKLQVRGDGVYSENPVTGEYENTVSSAAYGDNVFELDLPYQSDSLFAYNVANYIGKLYGLPYANIRAVSFIANESPTAMTAALIGEISEKVALAETVSGLTTAANFYINAVRHELDQAGNLLCTWLLVPADLSRYWQLGVAGASELGMTTVVAL